MLPGGCLGSPRRAPSSRLRAAIAENRAELMSAINRQTFCMNGFLAALLVAVIGLGGVVITRL